MDISQPFTVRRSIIFWTLLTTPSTGLFIWIVLILGFVFVVLGCLIDVRYLILGLIICLMALPAVVFFAFANYMLASKMVANILHHTVERHNDGYSLRIYRQANQEESDEDDNSWIEAGLLTFSDSNIVKRRTTNEYEVIFFKNSPLNILYVPRY